MLYLGLWAPGVGQGVVRIALPPRPARQGLAASRTVRASFHGADGLRIVDARALLYIRVRFPNLYVQRFNRRAVPALERSRRDRVRRSGCAENADERRSRRSVAERQRTTDPE